MNGLGAEGGRSNHEERQRESDKATHDEQSKKIDMCLPATCLM